MRISCNGCRVLRKGCSDDCTLRPCLDWIKSCESQANATLFLAKFYGRAGLLNLINAGPQHLRPAIFRSLLYEACGRIVNPVYGSVGLLWSKDWNRCQAAVDAVLIGSPIMQFSPDGAASAMHSIMPLNGCDIRHLAKDPLPVQNHSRFKLSTGRDRGKTQLDSVAEFGIEATRFSISGWGGNHPEELNRNLSHDSSMLSVETVEASLANQDETNRVKTFGTHDEESEVGLDLSLGYNPVQRAHMPMVGKRELIEISDGDAY